MKYHYERKLLPQSQTLTLPSLLVAAPHLQDPHFKRAVILLIEHQAAGALGFVINAPLKGGVEESVAIEGLESTLRLPIWLGGPVDKKAAVVLHNLPWDREATKVAGNVNLSSSKEFIVHLNEKCAQKFPWDVAIPFRLLLGYAGWGAGQLEEELAFGTWIQLPFAADLVFNTPADALWDRALIGSGMNPMQLVPPVQPYLN